MDATSFVKHKATSMLDLANGYNAYHRARDGYHDHVEPTCRYHQLLGALDGGYIALVQELLRSPDQCDPDHLAAACGMGDLDIIEDIWCRIADDRAADALNGAMFDAGKGGISRAVGQLIAWGATDTGAALRGACQGGHATLVEIIILWGARNYNEGMMYAAGAGHAKIVKRMMALGANDYNAAFFAACQGNQRAMMRRMARLGATSCGGGCKHGTIAGHFKIAWGKLYV